MSDCRAKFEEENPVPDGVIWWFRVYAGNTPKFDAAADEYQKRYLEWMEAHHE
jgi:hypothetical protein